MNGLPCDTLAAVLSERRSGELAPDAERALQAHLAGCARCSEEARALEGVLEALVPPEVSTAELQALASRRIGRTPPRSAHRHWGVGALVVAAAAAALLTLAIRPPVHHPSRATTAQAQAGVDDDFFAEEVFLDDEVSDDGAELDALTLEGPGIFGNLDR
jgi:anti-sigma factor RsiW